MTSKSAELPPRYSSDWLARIDGRTKLAQAARMRLDDLHANLGGRDALSYQERSLCKRIVWLEAQIEQREAALARGEEIDEGRHTQSVNALVGLLKTIGLQRRQRDVPTLSEYLANREASA